MKLLRLIGLFAVLAPALAFGEGVATPAQCTDTFEDCKEDCTMAFGTSLTKREELARCLGRCTRADSECKERYFDVTSNKLDDDALSKRSSRTRFVEDPAPRRAEVEAEAPTPRRSEPAPADDPPARADSTDQNPGADPDPDLDDESGGRSPPSGEPVRRSATRMSDLGKKSPPATAEPPPKASEPEEKAPAVEEAKPEEEPTPAKPPAKKKEAPRPTPDKPKPPEKKRSIDEWDPDAP